MAPGGSPIERKKSDQAYGSAQKRASQLFEYIRNRVLNPHPETRTAPAKPDKTSR